MQYLQRYLTAEQIKAAVAELRIDLTPGLSPERQKSGVLQTPGELSGGLQVTESDEMRFGLADLDRLLDSFVAIKPMAKTVSVETLERLLCDFSALRAA